MDFPTLCTSNLETPKFYRFFLQNVFQICSSESPCIHRPLLLLDTTKRGVCLCVFVGHSFTNRTGQDCQHSYFLYRSILFSLDFYVFLSLAPFNLSLRIPSFQPPAAPVPPHLLSLAMCLCRCDSSILEGLCSLWGWGAGGSQVRQTPVWPWWA